ncbi:hypothetical protein BDV18DRAFT_155878 [Aspergillus unguis]
MPPKPRLAREVSREVNEDLTSLCDQHPAKLGFFAVFPSLEDTSRCIDEIRYVGQYGSSGFRAYLARIGRPYCVSIHTPTMKDIENTIADSFTIPRPLLDWSHETTGTAVHLFLTNTLRRCASNCRTILFHGGDMLPFVAGRIADIETQARLSGKSPEVFLEDA